MSLRKICVGLVALGFIPAAMALAFGYLNRYLSVADSVAHFRLHLAVVCAAAAIFLLVLKARRWALIAAIATLAGFAGLGPALPHFQATPVAGQTITLVQFNTLFKNPSPQLSRQWISGQSPDVVTLQEVSRNNMVIVDGLASQMPSRLFCEFTPVYGVAVLSRFPKVAEKCLSKLGLVWMTVDIDGKPLTVASLHLSWPYPFGQWQQIESLRQAFAAMPRPVLISGDFNAAPWSEAVRRIAEATSTQPLPGLRLSLRIGAAGFGPYPVLPIDHILAPAGTSIASIELGPPIGSDHLPIVASIGINLQ